MAAQERQQPQQQQQQGGAAGGAQCRDACRKADIGVGAASPCSSCSPGCGCEQSADSSLCSLDWALDLGDHRPPSDTSNAQAQLPSAEPLAAAPAPVEQRQRSRPRPVRLPSPRNAAAAADVPTCCGRTPPSSWDRGRAQGGGPGTAGPAAAGVRSAPLPGSAVAPGAPGALFASSGPPCALATDGAASLLPPPAFDLLMLSAALAGTRHGGGGGGSAAVSPPAAAPPCAGGPACTKLLVACPGMPSGMQRSNWSLADFWISQRLYKGYASSVYQAVDCRTRQLVALKVYHTAQLEALHRYQVLREVQLHAQLQHPNIIQLYAAFQEGDDVVLVLEYATGGDLYGLLRRAGGRLPEQQAVDLVLQPFLSALAYMHSKGIVHRDIKPENMLLSGDGTIKVADFGLALDLNQERAVTRAGTLDYMAPEVLRCPAKAHPLDFKHCRSLQYTTSVDVWAVGVLAYELLVGFPPFASGGGGGGGCGGGSSSSSSSNSGGGGGRSSPAGGACTAESLVFPGRISSLARLFVATALQSHPGDRPTAAEMAASPWMCTAKVQQQPPPAASPTVLLQSGPGFGEAALLRCLLAGDSGAARGAGANGSFAPTAEACPCAQAHAACR